MYDRVTYVYQPRNLKLLATGCPYCTGVTVMTKMSIPARPMPRSGGADLRPVVNDRATSSMDGDVTCGALNAACMREGVRMYARVQDWPLARLAFANTVNG